MTNTKIRLAALVLALVPALAACGFQSSAIDSVAGEGDPPVPTVYGVRTDDRVAFLTIDDGVTRDPDMIRILRDAGVPATLFLTADYVRADPAFFRRLAAETGSVIENHTLTHPDLTELTYEEQRREICGTSDAYEARFGRRPTLLRPPYGAHDAATARAAAECGITRIVHWSAEIADGRTSFATGDRLEPGDNVLMHFRDTFAADVAEFVRQTRRAGLKPALLGHYLK